MIIIPYLLRYGNTHVIFSSINQPLLGQGNMKISIRSGVGTGPTTLAAFDDALNKTGVANFNLIRLSSVIPPGTEVVDEGGSEPVAGGWGDRLYAVYADCRAEQPNEEVWAGVGWVLDKATKRGMFVEHEGNSEKQVRANIRASLKSLMGIRAGNFGPIKMRVVGTVCESAPVCALVIAPYETQGWAS
jgi:arginine decarboxylase